MDKFYCPVCAKIQEFEALVGAESLVAECKVCGHSECWEDLYNVTFVGTSSAKSGSCR